MCTCLWGGTRLEGSTFAAIICIQRLSKNFKESKTRLFPQNPGFSNEPYVFVGFTFFRYKSMFLRGGRPGAELFRGMPPRWAQSDRYRWRYGRFLPPERFGNEGWMTIFDFYNRFWKDKRTISEKKLQSYPRHPGDYLLRFGVWMVYFWGRNSSGGFWMSKATSSPWTIELYATYSTCFEKIIFNSTFDRLAYISIIRFCSSAAFGSQLILAELPFFG